MPGHALDVSPAARERDFEQRACEFFGPVGLVHAIKVAGGGRTFTDAACRLGDVSGLLVFVAGAVACRSGAAPDGEPVGDGCFRAVGFDGAPVGAPGAGGSLSLVPQFPERLAGVAEIVGLVVARPADCGGGPAVVLVLGQRGDQLPMISAQLGPDLRQRQTFSHLLFGTNDRLADTVPVPLEPGIAHGLRVTSVSASELLVLAEVVAYRMPMKPPSTISIKLRLPFLEIRGTWKPNDAEQRAAWELYVEIITRVAAVPLAQTEGFLREALSSLHSLFQTTRDILRRYGPSLAEPKPDGQYNFGFLAVALLNFSIRPLLSRWHPALEDWEAGPACKSITG